MATSSPVTSVARCTCASEALPKGLRSIWEKISLRGRPYSATRQSCTTANGTGSTFERKRRSSSQYSCGRISERFARICPILTNMGPRSSSMQRKRRGVILCHASYFRTMPRISPMRLRRPSEESLNSSEGAMASGSSGNRSTARGARQEVLSASSTPSRLTVSSGLSGIPAALVAAGPRASRSCSTSLAISVSRLLRVSSLVRA